MTLHKKLLVIGLSLGVAVGGVSTAWSQTNKVPSATAPDTSPSMPMPWWKTSATMPATNSAGAYQCSNTGAGPTDTCPSPGAGNPINIMSGNKYQREEDMPALPGVLGLEIVRHYNSFFSTPGSPNGIMGRGWRLSYETGLHVTGRVLQLTQADGTRVIFNRDPLDPSLCASANPADGRIVIRKTARGDEYTLILPNGRKLDFSSQGKLAQILAPTGEFVTLQYDVRGMLQKVTDPQGRTLQLRYLDKAQAARGDRFTGVVAIDSPVGRFKYEYGSDLPKGATLDKIHVVANLVKVSVPTHYDSKQKLHAYTDRGVTSSSISRIYHYEDALHPTLLTGITITGTGSDGKLINQRIGTYGYNANGLGILTVKGEPARFVTGKDGKPVQPPKLVEGTGIEQVTMDYREPGQTTIKNSLGQETVYKYAIIGGGLRLLEVRGVGCASCDEPNMRYRYDRMGRLIEITKLDTAGQPLQTTQLELDYYGRVLKASRIRYRGGKPGQPQWLVRYEYRDDNSQPALIARPSVVPGRETVTRISYNEQVQPTRITESGWSPAAYGKGQATLIARIMTYSYASINGRSVLAQIDGPLPNGTTNSPADSDITRIDWDSKGNAVLAITVPGGFSSTVAYDDVGRIAEVSDTQGHKSTFTYSAQNQVIAMTTDGTTQRTLYDARGNAVETGYSIGDKYKALAHLGFDNAGRHIWTASHLGILERNSFDTEGNLLETTTQSASFKQTQSFAYDALGRLIAATDATGAKRRIGWNANGLPAVMVDSLGRETRYRYDEAGHVAQIIEAANTFPAQLQNTVTRFEHDALGHTDTVISPNGAITRYVRDDFGRIVATASADSGTVTKDYDVAGRLIASTDANGNRASYEYDVAGRIVIQTIINAKTTEPAQKRTTTVWRYEGRYLTAVEHPNQQERYRYDDQGRLAAKAVTLKLADNSQATSITRYRYDELGQLAAVSLPDGSTVNYKRNGQNQVMAVERSVIQTPWLAWLLPAQTIVKDLQRDIVGLKSLTYGNGIEASYQRSTEGALARIVYRHPNGGTANRQQNAALDALFGITSAHAAQPDAQLNAPANQNVGARSMLPGAISLPQDPRALLDHRYLWDVQGNLLHAKSKDTVSNYAYDVQDRLIAATTAPAGTSNARSMALPDYARYFYDGAGNRVLSQEGVTDQADTRSKTVMAAYGASNNHWEGTTGSDLPEQARYDATGQPDQVGKREYAWDALGKLIAVRQANRTVASYGYNHRGERIRKTTDNKNIYFLYEDRKLIAELNDNGRIIRQYLYLADQPVAVIDVHNGIALSREEPVYLAQIAADMIAAAKAWFSRNSAIAYLHNNHLGATELVTDDQANPIWKAAYAPYGKVIQANASGQLQRNREAAFKLNLRLPGQYEDEEIGLYYNDHRYYDPAQGRYLTPDPIGLRGGINSYAYVNGNPLKYIDPSGLVLFAFDGTGNSNPAAATDSLTNVSKFYAAYSGTPGKDKFYITGIGTTDANMPYAGSVYNGAGFDQRVQLGFDFLNTLIDKDSATTALDIDVVGFSRGAAEARVWTNLLVTSLRGGSYTSKKTGKTRCITLRFEGLWDTVPHLGLANQDESKYDFTIPPQVKYAAHAVALNEYRGGGANFNLRSINPSTGVSGTNRVERGFIGSHADIGGGYGTGDLSNVALMWMFQQAKAAGLGGMINEQRIKDSQWSIVTSPIIHDKSTNNIFPQDAPNSTDRDVVYTDGKSVKQQNARFTGLSTNQTRPFISYMGTFCDMGVGGKAGETIEVGNVKMDEYSKWLKANYGLDIGYNNSGRQACAPL